MALAYLYDPLKQWQNVRGVNNVAGWIEVFISGTQERAVAYSDFSGTLLPDRIPIDNDGRAVVIVDSEQAYRVEVHDANGGLLFTQYPVWTQQSGGGVGDLTVIESSDASVAIEKSVIGSVTTYDLSVAKDSTELLDWVRTDGYTMDGASMVPTYSAGTMDVGSHGVILRKGLYYHVTARYIASVMAMPSYNEFTITFAGRKSGGASETYVSRYDIADCSTQLHQEYEVSFDAMPSDDVELYASVSGLVTGVSVGLLDMEIHRVYSGVPAMPEGVASKSWVADNYQEKLTAGANIVIEDNVISATAEPQLNADWDATSGVQEILHKPDLSVYARSADLSTVATTGSYDDLLDKPEIPEQVNADWDASSGKAEILHKPDLSVYAEKTELEDYQEKLTAGDNITIENNVISVDESAINEIFPVTYNVTTVSEIRSALRAGKLPVLFLGDAAEVAISVQRIPIHKFFDGGTYRYAQFWQPSVYTSSSPSYPPYANFAVYSVNYDVQAGETTWSTSYKYISEQSDWAEADATKLTFIKNKPTIPPDNVFVATYNTTTYQKLSAAHMAGKAIFVTGVPSVLSAILPMTSFSTNPAMVRFSAVIGSDEYSAKIDQGTWSYNTVSIQADWNQAFPLTPSYINNKPTIPSGVQLVPPATPADANKVLTVNAFGAPNWAATASQVNSDWDATSGVAEILNKPTEKPLVAGDNITITEGADSVTISATSTAQVNADWDATSGVSEILNKPTLATVATSGSYSDLSDTPDLSVYAEKSELATVATSGNYNDLTNKPSIPPAQVNSDWDATSGVAQILNRPNEKELVAGDNITITESGNTVTISASASAAQVNADWDATSGVQEILHKPDLSIYAQSANLATVATTGSYTDLTDTPAIPAAQVNSDWDATSGISQILNKPEETTLVAGENISITESDSTLTISSTSAPQVNADWDATSGVAQILNKPDLSVYAETSDLSSVAFSGSYNDLSNTPDLSIYAQNANLAAVATTGSYNSLTDTPTIPAAQVNSDWDATSGVSEILNKPDLVDIVAGPGIAIDNPDGNTLRVSMAADYEVDLYSGTKTSNGLASFTLSEYASNFDRIRFYGIGYGNTKVMYECPAPDTSSEALSVCYTYYCRDTDNNPWQMRMGVYTSTNGLDYSIRQAKFLYGGDTALAFGGGNTTQNPPIYRIVGIKRIAGGN